MAVYKLSDQKLQQKIGWKPFDKQKEVLDAYMSHRDIRLAAGRRFGKSMLSAYFAIREFLKSNKHVWVVSPSYDLSEKVFSYITRWVGKGFPLTTKGISLRPVPRIDNPLKGSWIQCKSAENPTGLLGEELDLVIVDEAARLKPEIWQQYIYPCLSSRKGKSVMISTPFGKNFFYRDWLRAKNSSDGASFRFQSKDNPSFSIDEWERARGMLPEMIFKQEYEALFLDDAASVFRSPRRCAIDTPLEEYNPSHLYLMGADLGRYHDFTVLTVVDRMTNQIAAFERFNQIDWEFQKKRIIALADKFNSPVWIDSTAITVGDAYVRELSDAGLNVSGYKLGNISKRQLVEKLAVMIDQKFIKIPNFPEREVLIDELESFGYELTPSGNIRYQAPQGLFDDCVISLALAVWELDNEPLTPITKEDTLSYPIQTF